MRGNQENNEWGSSRQRGSATTGFSQRERERVRAQFSGHSTKESSPPRLFRRTKRNGRTFPEEEEEATAGGSSSSSDLSASFPSPMSLPLSLLPFPSSLSLSTSALYTLARRERESDSVYVLPLGLSRRVTSDRARSNKKQIEIKPGGWIYIYFRWWNLYARGGGAIEFLCRVFEESWRRGDDFFLFGEGGDE